MAETFASAFAALSSFRRESEEEGFAWLRTIAHNQLYRWSKRGTVERRQFAELGIVIPMSPPATSARRRASAHRRTRALLVAVAV
jgi:DNA-directed RNA polymerase specialized sigma24 family protein